MNGVQEESGKGQQSRSRLIHGGRRERGGGRYGGGAKKKSLEKLQKKTGREEKSA